MFAPRAVPPCALAALFTLVAALPAHAESSRLRDSTHRYHVTVPAGFRSAPPPGPGVLKQFTTARKDSTAIVTRVDSGNLPAFRKRQRKRFFDTIEAGYRSSYPGYRQRRRRELRIAKQPVLDLDFHYRDRRGRSRRGLVRIIFFRSYVLQLVIDGPRTANTKTLRAIRTSFIPAHQS